MVIVKYRSFYYSIYFKLLHFLIGTANINPNKNIVTVPPLVIAFIPILTNINQIDKLQNLKKKQILQSYTKQIIEISLVF